MAYSETDTCWHILTVTRGGVVSILKNLDAPTARQTYQQLKWNDRPRRHVVGDRKATDEEISEYFNRTQRSYSIMSSSAYENEFKQIAILGPEGEKLEPWKGCEPEVINVGAFLKVRA